MSEITAILTALEFGRMGIPVQLRPEEAVTLLEHVGQLHEDLEDVKRANTALKIDLADAERAYRIKKAGCVELQKTVTMLEKFVLDARRASSAWKRAAKMNRAYGEWNAYLLSVGLGGDDNEDPTCIPGGLSPLVRDNG